MRLCHLTVERPTCDLKSTEECLDDGTLSTQSWSVPTPFGWLLVLPESLIIQRALASYQTVKSIM